MVTAQAYGIQNFDRNPEAAIRIKRLMRSWQSLPAMVQSACICKKVLREVYRFQSFSLIVHDCQETWGGGSRNTQCLRHLSGRKGIHKHPAVKHGIKVSSASMKCNAFFLFFSWLHAGSDKKTAQSKNHSECQRYSCLSVHLFCCCVVRLFSLKQTKAALYLPHHHVTVCKVASSTSPFIKQWTPWDTF